MGGGSSICQINAHAHLNANVEFNLHCITLKQQKEKEFFLLERIICPPKSAPEGLPQIPHCSKAPVFIPQ